MPTLISALKNEHTKRILRATRIRPPARRRGTTPHYRMPVLQAAGGYLVLDKYRGPEIPEQEWEDLTYTTYATDPATFFAPVTSATGKTELKGFWEHGKADLEGVWTENARKCPALVRWIDSAACSCCACPPTPCASAGGGCTWITTTRATRSPTAGSCGCGWS